VSDGFPPRAYAGVFPSRDEVDEDEARSLRVRLVFCRGRKTVEAQIRLLRWPRAAWTMMKVGQSMVGP